MKKRDRERIEKERKRALKEREDCKDERERERKDRERMIIMKGSEKNRERGKVGKCKH